MGFSSFASLTISGAWQIYGEANGASTLEEMRARGGRYRRVQLAPHDDPKIGCVLIRDVTFFEEPAGPPPDFAANVVQGKTYPFSDPSASPYFDLPFAWLLGVAVDLDPSAGWHRPGPALVIPGLPRPGSGNAHSRESCAARTPTAAR